jgi:hypothetical protein
VVDLIANADFLLPRSRELPEARPDGRHVTPRGALREALLTCGDGRMRAVPVREPIPTTMTRPRRR